MGNNLTRCVEEQICGGDDFTPSAKTEPQTILIQVQIDPDIEEEIERDLENRKLSEKELSPSERPSLALDSVSQSDDSLETESKSDESVMTAISPTKDSVKKTPIDRSLKGPPQGTWSPKVESFYLSPIKVNTSRKPSKVSSELIEELSSIHDIENAILFNDMNRLFLCRSKDYLFTKYHFQNYHNKQALHLAVLGNDIEVVKYILSFSPNVVAKDQDGETPLSLALTIGNAEIIQLLKQALPLSIDSPDSPFPCSSVITSSYQESMDENQIQRRRAMSDLSNHFDFHGMISDNSRSDWTEHESQTTSMLSGKHVNPYKRYIPKKIRHAAKQIAQIMGTTNNHKTYKKLN